MKQKITKGLEAFLTIIMGLLVLDVVWQVLSRYILQNPSSFTDELAGFLLIWVGLFGAAWATGANSHLAIDLAVKKLSIKNQLKIQAITQILVAAFAIIVMIIGGTWLVYTRFYLGQISAAMQLPLGIVYSAVPLSGALIAYYSIHDLLYGSHSNEKN